MSEIDTSAAAIEAIRNMRAIQKSYGSPPNSLDTVLAALAERDAKLAAHDACLANVREDMPEVGRIKSDEHWQAGIRTLDKDPSIYLGKEYRDIRLLLQAIDTLLAALAERQEEIEDWKNKLKDQEQWARTEIGALKAHLREQTEARVEAQSKLAAHDACLTQVREEMLEVEKARDDLPPIRKWFNKLEWDHVDALFKAVDTLQQNEARWRAARDVWEAERNRLQERIHELDRCYKYWQGQESLVSIQLSASNAACAEMRERLTWHPMSSAPKDRNLLLVRREPLSVTYGYWLQPDTNKVGDCGGDCRCPEYDDAGTAFWWSEDGGFTSEDPPTAWMLPPSPLAWQENDNG